LARAADDDEARGTEGRGGREDGAGGRGIVLENQTVQLAELKSIGVDTSKGNGPTMFKIKRRVSLMILGRSACLGT
jgi:hypothetical protein